MWETRELAHTVASLIEIAGILVVVIGGLYSLGRFLLCLSKTDERHLSYSGLRRNLGRSILLGLEFLVAGDIISTVTIEPTVNSVAVLGLIVLIRTFLSMSLEVEIEGHWPWSKGRTSAT